MSQAELMRIILDNQKQMERLLAAMDAILAKQESLAALPQPRPSNDAGPARRYH